MPVIKVRENEPFDVALRRFKRSCEKAGILADVRAREFRQKVGPRECAPYKTLLITHLSRKTWLN